MGATGQARATRRWAERLLQGRFPHPGHQAQLANVFADASSVAEQQPRNVGRDLCDGLDDVVCALDLLGATPPHCRNIAEHPVQRCPELSCVEGSARWQGTATEH
eukprot:7944674-Alexandrium_andersonii.AAC.1